MNFPQNNSHNQSGISLLECLFGMLLTTVFAGLLIAQVHPLLRTAKQLHDEARIQHALARLSTILDTATTAIDSHRLSIAAIVHPQGNIAYTDGTPHQIQQASEKALRPSPKSDAFSVLHLEMEHLLTVTPTSATLPFQPGTPLRVCYKTNLRRSEPLRSVLAISVDGPAELTVDTSTCDTKACCELWLHAAKSIIAPQAPQLYPLVVVPIRHLTTYYVTDTGVLRTLQHVGQTIIENQPILTDCPNISVTLLQSPTPFLHLAFAPPISAEYHLSRFARLSRLPYYHLLSITP